MNNEISITGFTEEMLNTIGINGVKLNNTIREIIDYLNENFSNEEIHGGCFNEYPPSDRISITTFNKDLNSKNDFDFFIFKKEIYLAALSINDKDFGVINLKDDYLDLLKEFLGKNNIMDYSIAVYFSK